MLRSWGLAPTLTRALAAPSCGVLATPSVPSTCTTVPVRQLNANRCVVTKVKRAQYSRQFPTMAALPDGSTITSKAPSSSRPEGTIFCLPIKIHYFRLAIAFRYRHGDTVGAPILGQIMVPSAHFKPLYLPL